MIPLPESNDELESPDLPWGVTLPNSFFLAITYEAEAEEKTSETVIQKIFDELPVP